MNLLILTITAIMMVHISPVLSESKANAFIAAMLPQNGNYNSETISADDLAETIYQNLIKRKLPPQEQIVYDKEIAAKIRDAAESEAIEEARRRGQAREFLHKMKRANLRRRRLLKLRRMAK